MTKEDVKAWLRHMRFLGFANTDAECAEALGISRTTLHRYKLEGAPRHIALACQAVICRLSPYKEIYTVPESKK